MVRTAPAGPNFAIPYMDRTSIHILALETSSSNCDVALLRSTAGEISVFSRSHSEVAAHAERLLPMVDELLAEVGISRAELGAVAFGQGPGGFTGLRVACGVAQGLAFALGLPVIPVVSLRAVVELDAGEEPVRVVVQDARMGEVYVAAYLRAPHGVSTSWETLADPMLLNWRDVVPWIQLQAPTWDVQSGCPVHVRLVGDALDVYPDLLDTAAELDPASLQLHKGASVRSSAASVARLAWHDYQLGRTLPADQAAPLYVRNKVAYTTAERERGLGGNPKAAAPVMLRAMTEDDIDSVVEIERSVQSFPWTKGNFVDALKAGYMGYVAVQGKQVVGFSLMMFAPDLAHLLLIGVSPDHQRKGTGHQLLRHCEQLASQRGLPALLLEVRPSNRNAIDFYLNRGFEKVGMRKDYYPKDRNTREDAWVMQKKLKPYTG